MNSNLPRWNLRRAGALFAACALTAGAAAQFVPTPVSWDGLDGKENWVSASAAWISVDGSTSTYQRMQQHNSPDFFGLDSFRLKRELDKDSTLTIDGKALADDNEYRLAMRYDNTATGIYAEAGWKESRIFYDGLRRISAHQ